MTSFPGLKDPLLALSLLAIEPGLKGVLIGGPPGTGKTTVARAAKSLFPANSPFVNVPLGCTLDRLVGGVDLERSYKAGKAIASPGLLAEAHGGVLYVDEINLLPPELISAILQASLDGQVQLEREGISQVFPTEFSLIGTFNPAEGEMKAAISARVAFSVWTQTLNHLSWRVFLATKASSGVPMEMAADIIHRAERAREILPLVEMSAKQVKDICKSATAMGVEGNRMEIMAMRCAKANAALHHRIPVTNEDVELAKRLIFLGRMGAMPMPGDEELDTDYISEKSTRKKSTPGQNPENPGADQSKKPEQKQQEKSSNKGGKPRNEGEGDGQKGQMSKDMPDMDNEEGKKVDLPTFSGNASSARLSGKHLTSLNLRRGRHVRSVPGLPSSGRLDLTATLKAAALSFKANEEGEGISVKKEHFRIKQFRQRSGLLFIFAIDGSGSMAINHYYAAKGAALSLLEKAYVFRDQVAIVYFRHQEAKLLLPPGSSMTKASRTLKRIKAGGKTPIGSAMLKSLQLCKQAKSNKKTAGTVLILFTDGRANQPLKPIAGHPDPESLATKELKPICKVLGEHLDASILFDTRRSPIANLTGRELSSWLGGQYIYLPKAEAGQVTTMVANEVKGLR